MLSSTACEAPKHLAQSRLCRTTWPRRPQLWPSLQCGLRNADENQMPNSADDVITGLQTRIAALEAVVGSLQRELVDLRSRPSMRRRAAGNHPSDETLDAFVFDPVEHRARGASADG